MSAGFTGTAVPAGLTAAHRTELRKLADEIVPRNGRMPSASDLDLCKPEGLVDKVLRLRPDLALALDHLLASNGHVRLENASAADIDVLMQVVAGAYYMHPEVRRLIGYFGQEAQILPREGIGGEDLLAAMMERPPRWRRAPSPDAPFPSAGARA